MTSNIRLQTAVAKGTKALNKKIKILERIGATVVKVDVEQAKRLRRHSLFSLPDTFLIRYRPAIEAVREKVVRPRPKPWLKPAPFYPNSKNIRAPGVRV